MATNRDNTAREITLFLCGDVMIGRGIDQILPHPGDPELHEPYVKSARHYVELAEKRNGPIPKPAMPAYVWGDALAELRRLRPDARIINLETSITESTDWQPKGINYKMHPENVACLTTAGIDCCALANNHVLDWGDAGLSDTLDVLQRAGVRSCGAGRTAAEARRPAVIDVPSKGRVLIFAFGASTSGITLQCAASENGPGVNLLPDLTSRTAADIARGLNRQRRPGDIVVASIHWGDNWGYEIPFEQRDFAHRLIDAGGADVIHGHSSHHPKSIEVYQGRPILYGCGDFLNDYEGIGGYEAFRGDLTLMYFVTVDPVAGTLCRLEMTPLRMRNFRLNRATKGETRWLCGAMDREARNFGGHVQPTEHDRLFLRWR
jgi:poly-gamma-glutamate synthesis protein (capsule biosynthesis protein)